MNARSDVIAELISKSHGEQEAAAYGAFNPDFAQRDAAAEVGKELLGMFPRVPGACLMMSALYAIRLKTVLGAPIYVAAGSLYIGGIRVFGEANLSDGEARFSRSDPSWDGHAWVILGSYIADASLFRTAYSRGSPPLLATHVRREFGEGRGLLICRAGDACGLEYVPQYILSEEQITALGLGAFDIIESQEEAGRH